MPAQSDNTLVLVNGLTRLIGGTDYIEFTGGLDNTPIGVHGASTLAASSGGFTGNVGIGGDLTVQGSIVSSGTLDAIVKDQYIDLIHGNADTTNAKSGGFTANLYPSAAIDTGGAAGLATASFTAGIGGVSDAKITLGAPAVVTGAGVGGIGNNLALAVNPTAGDTVTLQSRKGVADIVISAGPGGTPTDFAIDGDINVTAANLATCITAQAGFGAVHGGVGTATFTVTANDDNLGALMNDRIGLSFVGASIDITSASASFAMIGGGGLGIGDIIEVASADDEDNNGLFQISSVVAAVIDVTGMQSPSSTQAPFVQSQFVTNATDTAAKVRGVNIAAMAFGNAIIKDASGSALPVGTLSSSYTGINTGVPATSKPANVNDIYYTPAAESTLQGAYDAGTGDITLAVAKDLDVIMYPSAGPAQGSAINLGSNKTSQWLVGDANNTTAELTIDATQVGSKLKLHTTTSTLSSAAISGAAVIANNATQLGATVGGVAVSGLTGLVRATGNDPADRLNLESTNGGVYIWSGLAAANGAGVDLNAADSGVLITQGGMSTTEQMFLDVWSEASRKNGQNIDGFEVNALSAGGMLQFGRGAKLVERGQGAGNMFTLANFPKMVFGDEVVIQGSTFTFAAAQNFNTRSYFGAVVADAQASLIACVNNSVVAEVIGAFAGPGAGQVALSAVAGGAAGNAFTLALGAVADATAYTVGSATFQNGEGYDLDLEASSGAANLTAMGGLALNSGEGITVNATGGGFDLASYSSTDIGVVVSALGMPGEGLLKVSLLSVIGDTVKLGGPGEFIDLTLTAAVGPVAPNQWLIGADPEACATNLASALKLALTGDPNLLRAAPTVTVYGGHFIKVELGIADAALTTTTTGGTVAWEGSWTAGAQGGFELLGRGTSNVLAQSMSSSDFTLDVQATNWGTGKAHLTLSASSNASLTATAGNVSIVSGLDTTVASDGAISLTASLGNLSLITSGQLLARESVFVTATGVGRGVLLHMTTTDNTVAFASASNAAGIPPIGVSVQGAGPTGAVTANMLHGSTATVQICEAQSRGWFKFTDVSVAGWNINDTVEVNGKTFTAKGAEDKTLNQFHLNAGSAVDTAVSLAACINDEDGLQASVTAQIDGSGNNDGAVFLQANASGNQAYGIAATTVTGLGFTLSAATFGLVGLDINTSTGTIPAAGTLLYLSGNSQGAFHGQGQASSTPPSGSGDSVIRVGISENNTAIVEANAVDIFGIRFAPQFIANHP